MADTQLTVNDLRTSILNLVKNSIENPDSEISKSITSMIDTLTKEAIDEDNVNDINWDETDELWGEYVSPTSDPSSEPPTTIPQFTIKTSTGETLGTPTGTQEYFTIEDAFGKVVRRITYIPNGETIVSISHDSPRFTMYSDTLTWKYATHGSDIEWPNVQKSERITFNSGIDMYLLQIVLNVPAPTVSPETSETPVPSSSPIFVPM